MADDTTPTPAITPGAGRTPQTPQAVYLSAAQQQAIAASAKLPGWVIANGAGVPQTKMGTDARGNAAPIFTGEYRVTLTDPSGQYPAVPITITKGNPNNGEDTWLVSDLPDKPLPGSTKATSPTDFVVKTTDQGVWYPDDINDPGGKYHQILPPGVKNEDEEIKKAVDRQVAEGERNARQRNETATGIYGTDAEVATIQHQAAADKLSQAELNEKIRQFNVTQKANDVKQAAQDKVDAANILHTQATTELVGAQTKGQVATTAGTEATTAETRQKTQQSADLFPTTLAQAKATLAGTEETTKTAQQNRQIAAAPTTSGTPGASPYITTRNPLTGEVTQSQMDLAYQPKTQAEIAARVGQIQSAMQAKGDQVQAKVGTMVNGVKYTPEDANKEYNAWYAAQVAPQTEALKAAQDEAAFQRGKDQMASRVSAQNAATQYGTGINTAYDNWRKQQTREAIASPGFGAAVGDLSKGKVPTDWSFTQPNGPGPNPLDLYTQGTMNALKYIDPTAAAATGTPPPNYQQMDISALTRNPYAAPGVPGGPPTVAPAQAPPPQAPPAQAPPTQAPPPQGPPQWYVDLLQRQHADTLEQQRQTQVQMPDWLQNGTPPDQPQTPPTPTPDQAPPPTPTPDVPVGGNPNWSPEYAAAIRSNPWWQQMQYFAPGVS